MTTVVEHAQDSRTPLRADLSPADALALSCLVYGIFTRCPVLVPRVGACFERSPMPRPSSLCIAIRWCRTRIVSCSRPPARVGASGASARARRGHSTDVEASRSVRCGDVHRRGRGDLRGLPRHGCKRGRVGGGCSIWSRFSDGFAAVGRKLSGICGVTGRWATHRGRSFEGRESGAVRCCGHHSPGARARLCVRSRGISCVSR